MTERRAQLSLSSIINHYTHWFGEFHRAFFFDKGLFANKLQLPKSLENTDGFKQFAGYSKMPAFAQLSQLHEALCRQAVLLYQSRKPFRRPQEKDFAALWTHFEKLITQLQKIDKTLMALESGILDPLTGFKVPTQLIDALAHELEKKRTHGSNFVIAMADVDHIDLINKNYSHDAGDFVLSEIAGRIGQDLRPYDEIYRLQDDKFIILLKQIKVPDARAVLERIRRKVSVLPVSLPDQRDIQSSISIGIGVPSNDALAEEVLDFAWRATAKAKENRAQNIAQVTLYPEPAIKQA